MAKLSDMELLFLSNLTYMKPEILYDENGNKVISPFLSIWENSDYKRFSVGMILNNINTKALRHNTYLKNHLFDGEISGAEWADMIDTMKQSDICELSLRDVHIDEKNSLSAYFTDNDRNEYVVFRGESTGKWELDFEGAYIADTEQQRKALDFINSIDAKNITVVGHSNGGNNAKYVALLSDKVVRCAAFNSQGFSQSFMDKYQDLIKINKYKITCYALDEDFVNILFYDIYRAKYYVKGHSPNCFYNFNYNEDGKAILQDFKYTNQSEFMAEMHSFINYVVVTVPIKERDKLFSYLGNILSMKQGKMPPDYIKKCSDDQIISFLISDANTDQLGLLLECIVKYWEYDKEIIEAFLSILNVFGLGFITVWFRLLDKLIDTDNILKFILEKHEMAELLLKENFAPTCIIDFFKKAADAAKRNKYSIRPVTIENLAEYNASAYDTVRDYSESIREILLNLTDEVANEKPYDVTKWDIWYRLEDWYEFLNIHCYQKNIDNYYQKVIEINKASNQQMQLIFYNIDQAVMSYTSKMREETLKLRGISNRILNLIKH